jgi:hypothetical protein
MPHLVSSYVGPRIGFEASSKPNASIPGKPELSKISIFYRCGEPFTVELRFSRHADFANALTNVERRIRDTKKPRKEGVEPRRNRRADHCKFHARDA